MHVKGDWMHVITASSSFDTSTLPHLDLDCNSLVHRAGGKGIG